VVEKKLLPRRELVPLRSGPTTFRPLTRQRARQDHTDRKQHRTRMVHMHNIS